MEWQTLTLFLSAISGGNFLDKQGMTQKSTSYASMLSFIPPELLPERLRLSIDFEDLTRRYVNIMVDLLYHESLVVRETAKEALGAESQPKMYSMVLLQLDRSVMFTCA